MLQISPVTRIIPPSPLTDGHWMAESFIGPRRWRLPLPAILLLLACMKPSTRSDAARRVADRTRIPAERFETLLDQLTELGLVVDADRLPDNPRLTHAARLLAKWRRVGWGEAAEYHLSTFDYPFVDYAAGGRELDTARMRGYVGDAPDTARYKRYPAAVQRFPLPAPLAELAEVPLPQAWSRPRGVPLERDTLFRILSLTFGQTGRITSGRWPREPLLRRTSPSGGARHPTEAYLLVLDVAGLPPGWYHVGVDPPELELLREERVQEAELRELFPLGYARVPIQVSCIVVLTSVFERNMFRYREPRTFRTVHMDAGHLASTAEMVAAALGVRAHVAYPDHDERIEDRLGLVGLEEGYMLSISFGVPALPPPAPAPPT
jgi:SagB-type dehydrogenase family enzyme